jgi:gliding motility-associated-like protein
MPNVFTPNGDTTNQYFVVPDLPNYPSNKVIIFNRWGNVVFEKENYKNDWDGGDLPSGTYYYVISAEGMETMKGTVTILRD